MAGDLPADKYDLTIKELFTGSEEELISFFGRLRANVLRYLNVEFPKLEVKRSDLILECRTETGPVAVHLEFQSANDKEIPFRMLRYATELHSKYKLPVYQLLIYFGDRELNTDDGLAYRFNSQNYLEYRFRAVDLGNITHEEIKNSACYSLYALLPLTDRKRRKRAEEEFLKECAADIAQAPLDLENRRKTLLRAEIFAGLFFEEEIIETVFREVENMLNLEESAGYRRIFEKGMEKGRQETLRENVLKLLHRKFKKLPVQYTEKIKTADEYVLGLILDHIFEINTIADLDEYL